MKRISRWLRSGPHRPLGYVWRVVDGQRQTLARRGEAKRAHGVLFSLDVIDLVRVRSDAVIDWYVWLVVDGQRETRVRRGEAHRALQFEYRRIGQALPGLLQSQLDAGSWENG